MRYKALGLIVLGIQVGLAHVVPHADRIKHRAAHAKRELATNLIIETEVITVTDYNAVVVVDKHGAVIKTVHNVQPTGLAVVASTSAASTTAQATTPASTKPSSTSTASDDEQVVAASTLNTDITTPSVPPTPTSISSLTSTAFSGISLTSSDTPTILPTTSAVVKNAGAAVTGTKNAGILGGFSIDYDPIGSNGCRNADADFASLAGMGVGKIRVYDIGCDLSKHVTAASAHGIKLMIGLNDITDLNNKLKKLITMVMTSPAGWSVVDTVYIGNELVNSGVASSHAVADAVSTAKGILSGKSYNGNVVTVDTFNQMAADNVICSTSSYCAANAHAFFDPTTAADSAGTFVRNAYNGVLKTSNGKRVVITETGWPNSGSTNAKAVPSLDNQRTAMLSIMKEFSSTPADVYLFQAFDASYKAPGAFGVEPFFGILDNSRFSN